MGKREMQLTMLLMIVVTGVLFAQSNGEISFALCEGYKGTISCSRESLIRIQHAGYGRTSKEACPYGNVKDTNCRSITADWKTRWACNGYNMCHLHASNNIYGDPCKGIDKYLEVKYECIDKRSYKDHTGKKARRVTFHSYRQKHLILARNTPTNVIYEKTYYNDYNSYNPHNGFFTAPSPGQYIFSWTSLVYPGYIFDTQISLNGNVMGLCACNNEKGRSFQTCSQTVPLIVKVGDKVNIRTVLGNHLHGFGWSSFKGWKIQ